VLKYLYVLAKHDPAPLHRAVERFLAELPFWPTHLTVRRHERSLLIVAELADSAAPGQRNLEIGAEGDFTAFDGFPIGPHLSARPAAWPAEIGRAVRRDRSGFFTDTAGIFGVAFGSLRGGVTAFSDFTGGAPIYYADQPDYVAVTNRAGLIGRVLMDGNPDLPGLSLLAGQANMFVPFTSYSGVRSLRPGWGVTVSPRRGLALFALPRFWTPASAKRSLAEGDLHTMVERLLEPVTQLAGVPFHEFTLSLTGGRDSRLCLALAVSAGLRPTCWTGGIVGSPEIECAQAVAGLMNVPYRAETFAPSAFDFRTYWERLKFNTYRYDGMLCLFDGNLAPSKLPQSKAEIRGLGGEILSINVKAHKGLALTSEADAVKRLKDYQQPMDPMGVQPTAVTKWQRATIAGEIRTKVRSGVDLEDLTDLLYVENRMSLWAGVLAQRLINLPIQPLCNFRAAQVAYASSASHRRMWRYHLEVLQELSPQLAEFPFLGTSWDNGLRPFMKGPVAPVFATSAPASFANTAASQVLALRAGWQTVTEFLLDHASSGFFELVDRQRLVQALRAGPDALDGYGVKEMHSLVGMQMFLSGTGHRRYEGYTGLQPVLDTNLPGLRLERDGDMWWIARKRQQGLVVAADTTLPAVLSETAPSLHVLRFGPGAVRGIRIDPFDRPGRAAVGRVVVRKGRKRLVVGPEDIRLHGATIVARKEGVILIEAQGDDPQLHIDVGRLRRGKAPLVVEVEIAASMPQFVIESFLDRGDGFTREGMRRILIDQAPGGAHDSNHLHRLFPDVPTASEPMELAARAAD
jgi:hypothetical protein